MASLIGNGTLFSNADFEGDEGARSVGDLRTLIAPMRRHEGSGTLIRMPNTRNSGVAQRGVARYVVGSLVVALAASVAACGSGGSDDDGPGGGGGGTQTGDVATGTVIGGCQVLPTDHVFNSRIDALPVHPRSDAFIATIGGTRRVHLDLGTEEDSSADDYYGIPFNVVDGALAWTSVTYAESDMAEESDCTLASDTAHDVLSPCTAPTGRAAFPIPDAPLIEGGLSAQFPADGDHHLLVVDSSTCVLWELAEAVRPSGGWRSNWTAAFDLASNALRPAGWTSADAAGFPILPLLLRAGEADTGAIRHALRFTIQSSKIHPSYVWPARHRTTNGANSQALPPMGQLFRLKAGVTVSADARPQATAIVNALKQYGMYVADGGSDMYITGTPDARWAETTFDVVQQLRASDFEAVDLESVASRAAFDPDSGALPPP